MGLREAVAVALAVVLRAGVSSVLGAGGRKKVPGLRRDGDGQETGEEEGELHCLFFFVFG